MKKIAYDTMKVDQLEIVDDSKTCCLKVNAVITREGVYDYPDGRAFKSKMELLKATRTARNAKITILDHPDSMVIMSQNQIYGTVEKPFFDRDRIRATLNFDKHMCPKEFLDKVRGGLLKDVSIGFYYAPDMNPGTWNGKPYDYVMRDIVIDHVAAGVLKGRCSFPSCGIGVDALMHNIRYGIDKVVKRGSQWCVVHCHPDGSVGETIKCFASKEEAEAMHRAIQAQKGKSNVSNYGGKKTMPETKWDYGHAKSPEEVAVEYSKCVATRMTEGMTREEAEAHCQPPTEPSDEATPYESPTQEDQEGEAPDLSEYEKCVNAKMAEGIPREKAEHDCRAEHPTEEDQQAEEVEPTDMERCVENKKDEGLSEEEAKQWCEAELAGEHQAVDSLINRSQQLIQMKEQRDIERKRQSRRHPL